MIPARATTATARSLSQIISPPAPTRREDDAGARPAARGKFIYAGSEKLYIRGITYGAFRPYDHKREYRDFDVVQRDFAPVSMPCAFRTRCRRASCSTLPTSTAFV